jgi:predicted nucleotidyltransferase
MNIQVLRDGLHDILRELKSISLVYLFGSQVDGCLGPMSDYDLAVLIDRTADQPQIQARFTCELARALGTDRVDVVLLNGTSIELAYAIVAQGIVLYERDVATRVEYEAQVLSRYGDYLPVLRAQFNDVLRGDENGTRVRRYRTALGRTERTLGQIAAAQRQDAG